MLQSSEFKPAWWLINPHLQTIAAKYFPRPTLFTPHIQTLELPDGDFIDLAWSENPEHAIVKPLVVMLHGLEGSIDSHYAKGMMAALKEQGWLCVLMHFRGCTRPNRQAQSYHSGDIRDISYLHNYLKAYFPSHPKMAMGFSLGGNVLINYLARIPENDFLSAAIICAPLHLASCSERINQGFSKLYQNVLVNSLKANAIKKINQKLISHISQDQVNKVKTLWDFDEWVTAPLNGFENAEHYYQQVSGRSLLNNIKQPCLIIHAQDDPFMNNQCTLPIFPLSKNITFEVAKNGGHVGFIAGNNPFKPVFWLEKRVPNYLSQFL